MMNFPVGEKKESFNSRDFDIETYIYFLIEDKFTGVVRIETDEKRGEILIIDGNLFCAFLDEKVGNGAIEEIIKIRGDIDVYFLEKERAEHAFHWYRDVRENPLVSWKPTRKGNLRKEELEGIKIMNSLGIKKPSKIEIKKILENEGMEFLVKN
jgi:hypothetical protein